MCLYTSCIHSIVDAQDLAGPYEVFDVVAVDAVDVVAGVGVTEGVGRHSQAGEGGGPLGRGGGGFALRCGGRAAVRQVPGVVLGVVVADVGEEDGRAGDVLEDFHRQGGVAVGRGGADDRLVRPVPVVGVVQERLGEVHGGEVVGHLGLALD